LSHDDIAVSHGAHRREVAGFALVGKVTREITATPEQEHPGRRKGAGRLTQQFDEHEAVARILDGELHCIFHRAVCQDFHGIGLGAHPFTLGVDR
jgi:hypothetical protein